MKYHPMLFSTAMVQAIRGVRKTHTRRIIKPKNSLRDGWPWPKDPKDYAFEAHDWANAYVDNGPSPAGNPGPYLKVPLPIEETVHRVYPRYEVGDRIWVKETFCIDEEGKVALFADGWTECPSEDGKWKPSIFMGRAQSKITLEIVSRRPVRLQDMNEEDAFAEGVSAIHTRELGSDNVIRPLIITAKKNYESLWNRINGACSWDANPWVWDIEFGRVEQ